MAGYDTPSILPMDCQKNTMMRRLLVLLLFMLATTAPTAIAQDAPAPTETVEANGVTLDLYFDRLAQGRVGVLHVDGDGVTGATARWLDDTITFFAVEGREGLYGLLATNWDQPLRAYDFAVEVLREGTAPTTLQTQFAVVGGGFVRQEVNLAPDQLDLLDEGVEAGELANIAQLTAPRTPQKLWTDAGFVFPVDAELTSPFGAVRDFNGQLATRHTGWDFRTVTGQPTSASAAGRVAFAGRLPIRGNYVLIDHGHGVYSGYAHLSVSHVTQGQMLNQGQILGLVGTTGRSSSAHTHLEFIVNGEWVDAVDFVNMWLP